ncbi:MAG TPA: hypothetical protein GX529_01635 [Firmicutes bacterium]|nr:hypothetical protein [Candidatus Fermentithermobacillaceae bacterium]
MGYIIVLGTIQATIREVELSARHEAIIGRSMASVPVSGQHRSIISAFWGWGFGY